MKIILIDPQGLLKGLNTGLGYLASSLKSKGYSVGVLDLNNNRDNEAERLKKTKDADIVGISIKSFTMHAGLETAKKVREISPSATIIFGGPHLSVDGVNFIKDNNIADLGLVGEGEEALIEIIEEKPFAEIEGLIYRNEKGDVIRNKDRRWNAEISDLRFPDYRSFDSIENIEDYPLLTSRGCPYPCSYCSVPFVIGKKWRGRTPDNVIEELKYAMRAYKTKRFNIIDDNFTLLTDRARAICQQLIDENLGLEWSCVNGIRADRLDLSLLKLMKESGCELIMLGVESGDDRVFDLVNKGEHLQKVKYAITMGHEAGIRVGGFFILGLQGSTFESDMRSLECAMEMKLEIALFGIMVPYPCAPVWDQLHKDPKIKFLRDWQDGFHFGAVPKVVFESEDYSAAERVKAYYITNLRMLNWQALTGQNNPKIGFIKCMYLVLRHDPLHMGTYATIVFKRLRARVIRSKASIKQCI
jgi:radical SAM superfamily enzyme YgiQ (UPF0313 family)